MWLGCASAPPEPLPSAPDAPSGTLAIADGDAAMALLGLIEGQPEQLAAALRWVEALHGRAGDARCPHHIANELGEGWQAAEGCTALDGARWEGTLWREQDGPSERVFLDGFSLSYDPASDPLPSPAPAGRAVALDLDGELRAGPEAARLLIDGLRAHPHDGAWFHDAGLDAELSLTWLEGEGPEGRLRLYEHPAHPGWEGSLLVRSEGPDTVWLLGADEALLEARGGCWFVTINGEDLGLRCP